MIRYIEIDPLEIPISKIYTLWDKDYIFEFSYNAKGNFISVNIKDTNLVDGEYTSLHVAKLVYGNNLFSWNGKDFPYDIIPLTENDLYKTGFDATKVNKDTLGTKVFLFFEDGIT